jgi:hypothetical protein
VWIFFIFWRSKIHVRPTRVASSLSPPGAISPPADIVMPPRRVTLHSHWAKMSTLTPLHLPAMIRPITSPLDPKSKYWIHAPNVGHPPLLRPVASPLKSKLKYWIHTPTAGHPPQTAYLPPSTAIKKSSQPWSMFPPLDRVSILPPRYPEHHDIRASPATVIPFHRYPTPIIPSHNNTHGDELADTLSLSE